MSSKDNRFWRSGQGIAALLLIVAVSYFLLIEHRQHFFEYLPYLILLACPLMHVFMHGGHGHGHHDKQDDNSEDFETQQKRDNDYRDGYIEGLKTAREEQKKKKEKNDAR
jgi:hypothetical protein